MYNISSIYDKPSKKINKVIKYRPSNNFTNHIPNQGIIFEKEVYKLLKKI